MEFNNLYQIKKQDLDKSTEVLADAFMDYSMFKYILGKKHNKDNIKIITNFFIKYAMIYGKAYASSTDIEGLMLFLDYDNYKFNLFRTLRTGGLSLLKLGREAGNKFSQYEDFCEKIHQKAIQKPHQYLMAIGVDPDKQGEGHGSKMLKSLLEYTDRRKEACYLETHTSYNVDIYRNYGFEVVSEDTLPNTDIKQWSMLKR